MSASFYILDGHTPVLAPTSAEGSTFLVDPNKDRTVRRNGFRDPVNKKLKIEISTVFLCLDHNFSGEGPPVLFETMVFGGELDESQERYCTWDEAVAGHRRWIDNVLACLNGQVVTSDESTDPRPTWHQRLLDDDSD